MSSVLRFLKQSVTVPVWCLVVVLVVTLVVALYNFGWKVKPAQEQNAESYAVGFALGRQLTPIKDQISLDVAARGLRHGIVANSDEQPAELDKAERASALSRIQNRQAMNREKLAGEELKRANEFMATIKAKPTVRELEPGLLIEPIGETKGPSAQPLSRTTVLLSYQATKIDDVVFDQSAPDGTEVRVDAMLKGLKTAISRMPDGATWNIYIAPELAFGASPAPGVPANSAVVYKVKLLKSKSTAR